MDCIIEGPEVVGHGEDLGIFPWAIVSKPLKDFKQYGWGFTVLKHVSFESFCLMC